MFEINNIKKKRKMLKKGNNSNFAKQIYTKFDLIMLNTFTPMREYG